MSRNTRNGRRLNATLRDRLRELLHSRHGVRMLFLRRVTAVALILIAGVTVLRPHPGSARTEVSILVAAEDLAAGTELTPEDVRTRTVPKELVPTGALSDTDAVRGRMLAAATRRGEFLTDVRLVGEASTRITTGHDDHAAVAIRPADPAVAGLIHPGREVDVIAAARSGQPDILAERAPVLVVHSAADEPAGTRPGARGQVIVVGLPQDRAAAVASAALTKAVTVTLR
ncbi:Flp pilus assembly protein CpaB [Halopolyspora algeriensis]|uniref:Flp pilus assembly protein CpaB n=1 Tax=Halopolyspora algeriensis TaxID=1500506 RepID=A0A368VQD1_9ACTN|nr:SAF domain-containing protein [Halopolyspora algeriensis]RCW43698.1 Flp pilus assembly protein CpaB [Halopolyspora algeriensis]TQM47519.1 Flp pilus assembly protein CpaB [Halopolyspora algeriensis]